MPTDYLLGIEAIFLLLLDFTAFVEFESATLSSNIDGHIPEFYLLFGIA